MHSYIMYVYMYVYYVCICLVVLTCPVEGQVFQQCPLPCSATCSDPNPICDVECTPRCACPVGQVIDTVNNKCVDPQQCPQNCTVS